MKLAHLKNKTLIILGGNPETGSLVRKAGEIGIKTIVIDPNPNSPAKRFSDESYEIDGLDPNGIIEFIKSRKIDGVLVGVADILVPAYQKVCEKLDLPCYATKTIIKAFSSKDGFQRTLQKYDLQGIPSFEIDKNFHDKCLDNIEFPVMTKPVDNGGGVGMKVSNNGEQLREAINYAMEHSKKGKFMVEKFMSCDDMFAYYTFKDGKSYLSATADRITTKKQGNVSPVCLGAIYPSKYSNQYFSEIHPKMINLFEGLGVKNGVLCVQFFVDNGNYYAYDPGFRLQGEAPHIPISFINGFDSREMLLNFALTGTMGVDDLEGRNDFLFKGKYSSTIWILLKQGVINEVNGLDKIRKDPSVIEIIQRLDLGDEVTPEMVGNERQVFAKIYIVEDCPQKLRKKIKSISQELNIRDYNGTDMIVDWLDSSILKNY